MIHLEENVSLAGCALTFPSVSVGNVGQLATDLLITKLKPKKIGLIWHSAIMPMVGGDPYDFSEPSLTTSAEIYYSEKTKLVIIQVRSPILPESSRDFVDQLLEWIKKVEIKKVCILTGVCSHTRHDNELAAPSVKFLVSLNISQEYEILQQEENTEKQFSIVVCNSSNEKIQIHGGGISSKLFTRCIAQDVPVAVIMKYCSEGDNIPDAQEVCYHLNQLLSLVPQDSMWESPPSWVYMYGNPPQNGLY